jgi:hypothetical protein
VKSRTRKSFWRDFEQLPKPVRDRAKAMYRQFVQDSTHPGLQFKQVHSSLPIWSVRITGSYRAVGVRTAPDTVVWFFIGTHAEYDRLLASL